MTKPMRLFITTIILTTLAQPVSAFDTSYCTYLKIRAESHVGRASDEFQLLGLMLKSNPLPLKDGDRRMYDDALRSEKDELDAASNLASIYSAFCK